MKKTIALTLTLILTISLIIPSYANTFDGGIPVPEFKGAVVDAEDRVEIMGYSKGAELLQNSIFTDTANHWAKKAITKMSAQSVIKGYGQHKFSPNAKITRQEVIASLVRMKGREGAIQENLSQQGAGLTGGILNDIWAEGYIAEAQNLGIITGNEDPNFRANTSREEIALWTARLLELDPVYDNIEILYTFNDWREISFENIGTIEAVLQERIMEGDTSQNFNPKSYITRAQFASILNNISDRLYEEREMNQYFGQVINVQRKDSQNIGSATQETIVTIKNVDGTMTSIIAKNNASGAVNEFVVYKNGVVSASSLLNIGDEVEYITKNDQVIYVEAHNDGSILQKIKESSIQNSNIRTYFGKITSMTKENFWPGQSSKEVDRFRVKNIDGQAYDIVVETDLNTGIKNDIIVYKNNKVGGSSLLAQGDDIEYVVKDNKTIVYVNVISLQRSIVSGTVKTVNQSENRITIVDYDDNTRAFSVMPYAAVKINLRPAALTDLKYGQNITLNINNGLVTSITGETFVDEPGYIPNESKVRAGKIKHIDKDNIIIEYGNNSAESFVVNSNTRIVREGRGIRYYDLREGDRVKLYFDNIYSKEISKIQAEGNEQLIKTVYKGELNKVDISDKEITLTDPNELKNSRWQSTDDYKVKIELDPYASIYYGGKDIDLDDLRDEHIDDDVYVVLEDSYGKDKGIKVVIKKGSEKVYNDEIDDINFASEQIELDNGKNVAYNDGTIIIKNNRLVSSSNLEQNINSLVVTDYSRGDYDASIIQIGATVNRMFDNIYVGKVDLIDRDDFEIIWYSELEGNEWDEVSSSSSKTITFDYSDGTIIADVTEEYDEITPYDFFHDGYSDEENEDYFTFIVADEDRDVIAMTLRKDELFKESNINDDDEIEDKLDDLLLTKGSVEDVDTLRDRLKISDPYDWSDFHEEWQENRNDEYVDIESTIFIKGDEVIDVDEVDEDDTIYILREDEDAIFIFVE